MLRSGTDWPFFFSFFFFFSSVGYSSLRGAARCGIVHKCSHTRLTDRFMMSEGGDPLNIIPDLTDTQDRTE